MNRKLNNMKEYRCAECNGKNIQVRVWISMNERKFVSECSDGDIEDNWCEDCKEHTDFKIIEIGTVSYK